MGILRRVRGDPGANPAVPAAPVPAQLQGVLKPTDVSGARFSATKLHAGYDEEDVDQFLDVVARDLGERWRVIDAGRERARTVPPPTLFFNAGVVRERTFGTTKFRQGYVTKDVDELVDQVARSMQRLDEYLRVLLT
jgi:DivIVA domain-containing protein